MHRQHASIDAGTRAAPAALEGPSLQYATQPVLCACEYTVSATSQRPYSCFRAPTDLLTEQQWLCDRSTNVHALTNKKCPQKTTSSLDHPFAQPTQQVVTCTKKDSGLAIVTASVSQERGFCTVQLPPKVQARLDPRENTQPNRNRASFYKTLSNLRILLEVACDSFQYSDFRVPLELLMFGRGWLRPLTTAGQRWDSVAFLL